MVMEHSGGDGMNLGLGENTSIIILMVPHAYFRSLCRDISERRIISKLFNVYELTAMWIAEIRTL